MPRVLCIFGTRPEAIKMAPVVRELRRHDDMETLVAVTAQHREMLDQVLELFGIQPDYDLNLMRDRQTLPDLTARALQGLDGVLEEARPDLVLVHGDTTTTMAGALGAFYRQVPVGHVEAGLRTGDRYSPFPEEINRRLTGALATWHFAPTATARANLLAEGVPPSVIQVTGNTVIDALLETVRLPYRFTQPELSALDWGKRLLLVTSHRRENLGQRMREAFLALHDLVMEFPDVAVVFPVHKNPAVRSVVQEVLGGLERVHLVEPLEYLPFVHLMHRSSLVVTDSGGLQEEAPALGKPVLVLRDTTERPEAVEAGTVELVGTGREAVYNSAARLLRDAGAYRAMANAVNPYGDGRAAQRLVQGVRHRFGLCAGPPEEFQPEGNI